MASEYKHYTEEQIAQANNTDLLEFVRSQGYTLQQVGRDYRVPEIGNSFYISPDNNKFNWFSHAGYGGVGPLNFAMKIMNLSFLQAMESIVGEGETVNRFIPQKEEVPKENHEFIMPEKADNCKKIYAYLINQRKISARTVSDFVKQGVLYQGFLETKKDDGSIAKHENAIFLHLDESGKPCGADVQGIYSGTRFKGIIPPSDTDKGFVYHKGNPNTADTVYLFEAPIDLMSFVELHPEIHNADFVAMGGLKPSIAEHYMNIGKNIVSCVDNDAAGQKFNDRILKKEMHSSIMNLNGINLNSETCSDREPSIEYINAEVNGRKISFFLSRNDYDAARNIGVEMSDSVFVWVNRSKFTVNRECMENGVKDFNELLQSRVKLTKEQLVKFQSHIGKEIERQSNIAR